MADININEVYEELKYLGELPETSRLIKDYLALREKKREKKYEYSVHPADVYGVYQHRSAAELNVKTLKTIGIRAHLVRREVGEWEEVKDGE